MADEATKRDVALYHPYISFRDPTWLKEAILYWDKIYRIAPQGYDSLSPPEYWKGQRLDMQLLEEKEVVERYAVELEEDHTSLTTLWSPFLTEHGEELANYYRLDLSRHPFVPEDDGAARGYVRAPGRRRKGVGWLLGSQMARSVFKQMLDLGIAIELHEDAVGVWYGFDIRLLNAYMTTLSNSVTATNRVDAITDSPGQLRLFTQNSMEALRDALLGPQRVRRVAPVATPDGSMILNLAIRSVCPAGLESLSFREVMAIRGEALGPRAAFKASMRSAEADLRGMYETSLTGRLSERDLEAVRARHIDKPLKELRKAMRTSLGDAVISVITLKSPLEVGTMGAAALTVAHSHSALLTGIGIAVGLVPVVRAYAAQRAAAATSPLGWLLNVERQMGERETIEAVTSPLRPLG